MSDSIPVSPAAPVVPASTDVKAPAAAVTPASKYAESKEPKTDAKPEAVAETPAEKKKRLIKIKVDGEEEEIDFDALDDNEIATRFQLEKASRKRLDEAAKERKEVEAQKAQIKKFLEMGASDPRDVLQNLFKVDPRKWAEEYLRGELSEEALPPEQKEKLALQRQIEEYQAKLKAHEDEKLSAAEQAKEAQRAEMQAQLDAQVHAEYKQNFQKALTESGLPETRETMMEMARIAKLNLEHGIELTPSQLASETRKKLSGVNQSVLRSLKGAALESYLGPDVVKEIVRMSIEKVKGARKTNFDVQSPPKDGPSLRDELSPTKLLEDRLPTKETPRRPKSQAEMTPAELRKYFRGG